MNKAEDLLLLPLLPQLVLGTFTVDEVCSMSPSASTLFHESECQHAALAFRHVAVL
jgi:hypothetical protein